MIDSNLRIVVPASAKSLSSSVSDRLGVVGAVHTHAEALARAVEHGAQLPLRLCGWRMK